MKESIIVLNFSDHRTDRTVKHIEVLLDESTRKYRVKDESDAVSYANFLQFDSIQQLLDQCKQHASKAEETGRLITNVYHKFNKIGLPQKSHLEKRLR